MEIEFGQQGFDLLRHPTRKSTSACITQ